MISMTRMRSRFKRMMREKRKRHRVALLSNRWDRNHRTLYNGAFYDLDLTAQKHFRIGQTCIVATPVDVDDDNCRIEFGWFKLERIEVMPNPTSVDDRARVFFGEKDEERTEVLSRQQAISDPVYRDFFDCNGNFKRGSVFWSE